MKFRTAIKAKRAGFGDFVCYFITDAVGYVGNATTPLSIICIGFMLSRADFKAIIKKWRLVVTALTAPAANGAQVG